MSQIIDGAAALVNAASETAALKAGLPSAVASTIGDALGAILKALLSSHDPGALARDLAAEAAHRTTTRAVIQAALNAQGGRDD